MVCVRKPPRSSNIYNVVAVSINIRISCATYFFWIIARTWRLSNADHIRNYAKLYRQSNKEELKTWSKRHYQDNKMKVSSEKRANCAALTDTYVINVMRLTKNEATSELISMKREQLKLHRLTKQLNQAIKDAQK